MSNRFRSHGYGRSRVGFSGSQMHFVGSVDAGVRRVFEVGRRRPAQAAQPAPAERPTHMEWVRQAA